MSSFCPLSPPSPPSPPSHCQSRPPLTMPERRFTIAPIPSFAELQQRKAKNVDDGESKSNLASVYSLSDEDSADSDELDGKEVERLSLSRPQKRSADSQPSSSQSTPTKKGKTTTSV